MSVPKTITILLLDDNEIDRETCIRHLKKVESVHYRSLEHNSIEGALKKVQEIQPDCILLDYHLHDGTGLDFLKQLTAIGGTRRYPVVMLTGTGSEAIAVEVMKIGAQDYISKDRLDGELLHRTIETAIYKAHTERLLDTQKIEMERLFTEAQEANARKDQFLAALSHELRTPLTPVLAAVSLAEVSSFSIEDFRKTFGIIRRNIELEARLIDDMLDLARISRGKLEISAVPADLHQLLQHAADACEIDRAAKNARIVWDFGVELEPIVVDPARMQQVFWNLLKNAIKFSAPGGEIRVTAREVDSMIEVEIADEGIGLQPGMETKIFDAFEQGDSEITRRFGGLGLGLAISKALVQAHHGTIHARNREGATGAVFTVHLPAVRSAVQDEAGAQEDHSLPSQHSGITILLVEDHADTAFFLSKLLEQMGFHLLVAERMSQALTLFEEQHVDILISDLGLPDGSGIELMKRIAAIRPIPAIALSGYGMESDIKRAQEAGFSRHLTKPVDLQKVRKAIQSLTAKEAPPAN